MYNLPEIAESAEQLEQLVRKEKDAQIQRRFQMLLFLKTGEAKSRSGAARQLGVHRHTVSDWVELYEEGGIEKIQEADSGGKARLRVLVEPETGQRFPAERDRLNSDCFQVFLDRFSEAFPRSHNIFVLDNGQFHKAKKLVVPSNVELAFLPPYSPELNPVEWLWRTRWPSTSMSTYRVCDKRPGWSFVVTPMRQSSP